LLGEGYADVLLASSYSQSPTAGTGIVVVLLKNGILVRNFLIPNFQTSAAITGFTENFTFGD
jgi:hypothetical protein